MASISILDEAQWRFEYKYRLPIQKYLQVKNQIKPYMVIDEYSNQPPEKKYLVRSLYYDSLFLDAFTEKIDGNSDRIKFRIRTYSENLEPSQTLRAEMKVRKGSITEKYGALITQTQYDAFITEKHWLDTSDPVLEEFERNVHLKSLNPVVLTQYLREGYRSRAKEDVRITFDHQVKSAHADQLFPSAPFYHEHHHGLIVLEIKCIKMQPEWLRQLVRQNGLTIMANSKFVQGLTVSHPALVSPSWST